MSKVDGLYGLVAESIEAELKAEAERRQNVWREIEGEAPKIAALRDLTIRALCSDKVAKASYFDLLEAGWRQTEFLELLVGIAVSVPRRGKVPNWLSGLGMTPKQMDYLPGRLNGLAGEIERLNTYPLLRPDICIHGRAISKAHSKAAVDYLGKLLMSLPFLLRVYAAFIDGHTKSVSRHIREKNRTGPRAQVLGALIDFVRKETGRPRYRELSRILSAAAHEAGLGDSDCAFEELTLRMLDSRRQKEKRRSPSP